MADVTPAGSNAPATPPGARRKVVFLSTDQPWLQEEARPHWIWDYPWRMAAWAMGSAFGGILAFWVSLAMGILSFALGVLVLEGISGHAMDLNGLHPGMIMLLTLLMPLNNCLALFNGNWQGLIFGLFAAGEIYVFLRLYWADTLRTRLLLCLLTFLLGFANVCFNAFSASGP